MIELKHRGRFELKNRGDVFSIDLAENNLPLYRKQINKLLLGKEVKIGGNVYTVKGIEMFGMAEEYEHSKIGLLI